MWNSFHNKNHENPESLRNLCKRSFLLYSHSPTPLPSFHLLLILIPFSILLQIQGSSKYSNLHIAKFYFLNQQKHRFYSIGFDITHHRLVECISICDTIVPYKVLGSATLSSPLKFKILSITPNIVIFFQKSPYQSSVTLGKNINQSSQYFWVSQYLSAVLFCIYPKLYDTYNLSPLKVACI